MTDSFSRPLLTESDVRGWIAQRAEMEKRISELDRKLEGVKLLFPEMAEKMLSEGAASTQKAPAAGTKNANKEELPLAERPITEVLLVLLEDEMGGRPPRWFRDKMEGIPGLAERVAKSPNLISNSLSRHVERGKLKKVGKAYYLPEMLARIESGEVKEDVPPTVKNESFASLMHRAMMDLKRPFKAADAIEIAQHVPELAERLKGKPAGVYSWLSREVFRHKLQKVGDFYSYPSQREGAPNGTTAGAPITGEAATSPIENQSSPRMID